MISSSRSGTCPLTFGYDGQNSSLGDGKSLLVAGFKTILSFRSVQAAKKFSSGISQPEKGLSAGSDKKTTIRTDDKQVASTGILLK
jgi:hypothetical protein